MNDFAEKIFRDADEKFAPVMREQLPLFRALEEVRLQYVPHVAPVVVADDGTMSVGGKWFDCDSATVKVFDTPQECAAEFFRGWIFSEAIKRENARWAVVPFQCGYCGRLSAGEKIHHGQDVLCQGCYGKWDKKSTLWCEKGPHSHGMNCIPTPKENSEPR